MSRVIDAQRLVEDLALAAHPEGGFYRETYRSLRLLNTPRGPRAESTAILFLLPSGMISAMHRIQSDEVWHFYAGDPLEIGFIDSAGEPQTLVLSPAEPQHVVSARLWFGSRPLAGEAGYSLVGCTVAPGFEFDDFEMGTRESLRREYPKATQLIDRLTRG